MSSGITIGNMLGILENGINNDSGANITAESRPGESLLIFKQKSLLPDLTVTVDIIFGDWQNGNPFNDMMPIMQP